MGVKKVLGQAGLKLMRYRVQGDEPPSDDVCVMVAYPHTSNWDFPLMLAMAWANDVNPRWLGKKELFQGPAGPVMRALGGIAVDRENPAGLVDELVTMAGSGDTFALVIPPEGTRGHGDYWKSGFYRIAADAEVPIVLTYLNGPNRTGGFGAQFRPSGDVRADMDIVRDYYDEDKQGLKPHRLTRPRLREEDREPGGQGDAGA